MRPIRDGFANMKFMNQIRFSRKYIITKRFDENCINLNNDEEDS